MLESKKYELPFLFAILLWGAWFYFFFMGATSFATSFVGRGADAASPTRRTIDMVIFAVLAALFPVGLWMAWDGTPSLWDKALVIFAIVAGPIGLSMLWAYIRSIASARQPSYVLRRDFEVWFAKSANLIILVVVLGMLPLLHQLTGEEARADQYGVVGLAFGLVSALYGHYSSLRSLSPGIVGKVSINGGAVVFLISFLLICFAAAHKTMEEAKDIAWNVIACGIGIAEILTDKALDCSSVTGGGIDEKMLMAAAFVSIAILVGLVCLLSMLLPNINYIGLHRYYRDRLMETFLPGTKSLECGSSISSPDADKFEVARLANLFSEFNAGCRPFPLINTNIILVNETNRKTQIRGGASFVITPFFTGSNETGWIKTEQYEKGQGPIQLASAMAVSGAAANSNAGYTGIGITRNRLVSMVMLLLNIRLGLWLTNPKTLNSDLRASGWMRALRRMFFIRRPRHGHPGLTYGLFGWGYQGNSHFIELSDGGHFEDLGIYELVRRKASLIIACDGEADKEISYAGLVSAARRIQEDFGAVLIFEENAGPERLVPRVELGYPSNTQGARSPYLVARIRYNDGTEGVVIYIKATMVADLGFVARGYRGKNPDFPHQSTVDQFFQSEQFEAYRELGYRSALRCIDELNLENNFDEPTAVWRQYLDRIDRE